MRPAVGTGQGSYVHLADLVSNSARQVQRLIWRLSWTEAAPTEPIGRSIALLFFKVQDRVLSLGLCPFRLGLPTPTTTPEPRDRLDPRLVNGTGYDCLSDLLARRRRPTVGTVHALCAKVRLTLAQ